MPVLFPFGHGLSYTTFEYSGLRLSSESIKDTDTVEATLTVTNTGTRSGKAVVQLYTGAESGVINAVRPVRQLKGFQKISLEPGESKEVSFKLDKRSFATWRTEIHGWWVESGVYTVEVGSSSADLPLKARLNIESTVSLPRHYDTNSIMMDILSDPKGKEIAGEFMRKGLAIFSGGQESSGSEAITSDMSMAMLNYMPLRGVLSFGGGAVTEDSLRAFLELLNK